MENYLVEDFYNKTKCAINVNAKITSLFIYGKGVRQGCPLSSLLFNYVNDTIHILNRASDSPIHLSENDPTNALMYADDLIVLAKSQEELQEKIDKLSSFLQERKLFVNEAKTKCMVFNRGNRLCKINLFINGIAIENVKTFKYLGFTLGAKNCSFNHTRTNLSIKTKLFALNNRIRISQMPLKLALNIYHTVSAYPA